MLPLELAEIRARCDAASPGPWTAWRRGNAHTVGPGTEIHGCGRSLLMGPAVPHNEAGIWQPSSSDLPMKDEDADFCAHARQDIPLLLSLLDAANDRILELEAGTAAVDLAGFRVAKNVAHPFLGPTPEDRLTLWCKECGRDSGFHWDSCLKSTKAHPPNPDLVDGVPERLTLCLYPDGSAQSWDPICAVEADTRKVDYVPDSLLDAARAELAKEHESVLAHISVHNDDLATILQLRTYVARLEGELAEAQKEALDYALLFREALGYLDDAWRWIEYARSEIAEALGDVERLKAREAEVVRATLRGLIPAIDRDGPLYASEVDALIHGPDAILRKLLKDGGA